MSTLMFMSSRMLEAACHVPVLDPAHRSHRLHGHSYVIGVRAPASSVHLDQLESHFGAASDRLDYGLLNDYLHIPTDENLARYIADALKPLDALTVSVQSTLHQGVDLDRDGSAHLWRRFRFEAAHFLPNVPPGHQCGRMHGHGFEVILHVNQNVTGQDIGTDLDRLGELWDPIHQRLHRRCLNDIAGLENPTSEMMAAWIWSQLKPVLDELSWVTVYETATAGCHYDGEHFRIWKEQRFESAVVERGQLLGHSYITRLHLTAPLDQTLGWTVDYGDVRAAFEPVYRELDHHQLDVSIGIDGGMTSILEWMRHRCSPVLPQLDRIDLYETPHRGAFLHWGEAGPALPGPKP